MDYLTGSSYLAIDSDSAGAFDAPNGTGSPERRLLLAILERAILDYVGNDEREMREAEEWLFGWEDDSEDDDSFSFVWLCKELDLSARDISEKIRSMPRRGNQRVAPWYFTRWEQQQEGKAA